MAGHVACKGIILIFFVIITKLFSKIILINSIHCHEDNIKSFDIATVWVENNYSTIFARFTTDQISGRIDTVLKCKRGLLHKEFNYTLRLFQVSEDYLKTVSSIQTM